MLLQFVLGGVLYAVMVPSAAHSVTEVTLGDSAYRLEVDVLDESSADRRGVKTRTVSVRPTKIVKETTN